MTALPSDHPDRATLANEVHARPFEPLAAPMRASYVAVLVDRGDREKELAHLAALCGRFGAEPPKAGAAHLRTDLGDVRLTWERHGEFSSYTLFVAGLSPRPFSDPVTARLPDDWIAGIPGRTIFAAHAKLIRIDTPAPDDALLTAHFDDNVVVGSEVGDGAGWAYTDFRVRPDGFGRVLLIDRSLTQRQAGRMLRRLFEVETYRMMALLALPLARRLAPRIEAIEQALASLTAHIANDSGNDESLLHELTRLAAEVESELAAAQFRFGACRAYAELVRTRIGELRERRIPGLQTIDEFMSRRFAPAVATCAAIEQRLHGLSERVSQASGLLSTRVDIARERQNQALLASMDRRARLQLRLQQTVEGLSVAAIVYYVAGLVGYFAKAGAKAGIRWEPDLVVGIAIPLIAIPVLMAVRRARRHAHESDSPQASVPPMLD